MGVCDAWCVTLPLELSYTETSMTLSVRLPDRVEQELAEYCVKHRLTKSEAVKQALEGMLSKTTGKAAMDAYARKFSGSDKRPGNVARHTKRFLAALRTKAPRDAARQSSRLLRALGTKSGRG